MVLRRMVILSACGTLCASALLIGAPYATANLRTAGPHWRVVARTAGGPLGIVVAPKPTSAWVFGWGAHPPDGPIFPIGRHWNGRRWSAAQFPGGVKNSGMSCAGASSAKNVWAFSGAGASGGNPPGTVSALRRRAGHWALVRNFPGSYVTGCNVLSATNVWVFGGAVAGLGPPIGTWHFSGSAWRQFNTGSLVLFNASAVSATDVWAVGADVSDSSRIQPAIGRWNGRSWREIRSIGSALPTVTSTTKVGVANIKALSASNVWVLATVFRQSTLSFLVVHWNGHTWSRVKPGSPGYYLPTAVRDGNGGWWSAPYLPSESAPYLLHRTHTSWARVALPVRLSTFFGVPGSSFGITHVPHSNAMLVAGTQMRSNTETGVVLVFGRLPT